MKKLILLLLFLLPTAAFGQSVIGTITILGATCAVTNACVQLPLGANAASAALTLTGTWTATIQFEASPDGGTTWVAINGTPPSSTTAVTSATANGAWTFSVGSMTHIRARASALASGTVSVNINATLAPIRVVGSSGGGTVTSVSGTANQITSSGGTTPVLSLPAAITLPGTINKLTLTAPATGATITLADNTTQTFSAISGNPWSVISAQAGNTDTVACPNNTTANFATTYTIPANYLVTNKLIRLTIAFNATTSGSPPNTAIFLNVGGVNVYQGAQTATASITNGKVMMSWLIQGTAAAGAAAAVYTHPGNGYISANAAFTPFATGAGNPAQPVNLATNGTMVIQPVLFCSVNTAGNNFTIQQMVVESD